MLSFLFSTLLFAASVGSFSDQDLTKLLESSKHDHKKIVLYTWSSQMAISQKGHEEILKYRMGFEPVVLLDPKCNLELAQEMVEKHHWPMTVLSVLRAPTLVKMGLRTHYPSYIFIADGKMQSPVIPGYKLPGELQKLKKRYFK